MKKVLVFGGSGFIGAEICNLLAKDNYVICADNYSRNEQKNKITADVNHEKCDITNYEQVKYLCKDVDEVINLAFINGTKNFYERPRDVFKVALEGQLNVLRAIRGSNVNKFIYASSSEVYQTPNMVPTPEKVPLTIPDIYNPRYSYGGGKILGELMCFHYLDKNIPFQIFRPHNIYGPNMGFEHVVTELIKKIYSSEMNENNEYQIELQGSGKTTRSFCFIKDFGQGFMKMRSNGLNNEIYNIGTNDEVEIFHLLKLLSKITNRKITFKNCDSPAGSTLRRCPNIEKLEKIGYVPTYSLEKGLRITNDWYLKTYG